MFETMGPMDEARYLKPHFFTARPRLKSNKKPVFMLFDEKTIIFFDYSDEFAKNAILYLGRGKS